jgi:light-regulated signal transduction histidine kinase (bacteriophytochrome)
MTGSGASTNEVEELIYVLSHDLREPLRKVTGFAALLKRHHAGALGPEGGEYVDFMLEACERLEQLIEDLLNLSRVSTRAAPPSPTSTRDLVQAVLDDLAPRIEEVQAEIEVGDLPTVLADRTQLRQVFAELIGNAVKFNRGEHPHIEVRAEAEGNGYRFTVADDGIGIDPEQAGRVFGVFQRLHTREEYPGTGIGLAMVKRIVERHGGRVWVEPKPGDGAAFHFTLPAAEPETTPS